MIELTRHRSDGLTLAMVLAPALLVVAAAWALPGAQFWLLVALCAAPVMLYTALNGRMTVWIWVWVLSFGMLDRWFWILELPGFFNLTIPRILFVATVATFMVNFLLRRRAPRFDSPVLWVMALLLAYVAIDTTIAGWTSGIATHKSAPYYRFWAGMLSPFIAFFLMYNSVRTERQVRFALLAVTVYGFYALYISYCQSITLLGAADLRGLIWPSYINIDDPKWGLDHFDRARGAFPAAGMQSVLLVLLFYIDLYLLRHVRGPYRLLLWAQVILIPPALVFTGIRAGFVSFAVGGVIWCLWGLRGRFGWAKLSAAILAAALAVALNWAHVSSTDRMRGGVGDEKPVAARILLAEQTARIVAEKPVFGVGFGHFMDYQRAMPQDPGVVAIYGPVPLVQHNIFLNMVAETGLVGLAIYVTLFVVLLRESIRLYRRVPPDAEGYLSRDFVVLFWVVLAEYLTSGMFRDMLWDPFANAMLWSMAGLTLGCGRILPRSPLPSVDAAAAGAGSA